MSISNVTTHDGDLTIEEHCGNIFSVRVTDAWRLRNPTPGSYEDQLHMIIEQKAREIVMGVLQNFNLIPKVEPEPSQETKIVVDTPPLLPIQTLKL